jgi:hypothetical protein
MTPEELRKVRVETLLLALYVASPPFVDESMSGAAEREKTVYSPLIWTLTETHTIRYYQMYYRWVRDRL